MTTGTPKSRHRKPKSISGNLRKLHNLFSSKDKILVTIDADPDSMASAMALKRILWRRVHTVTIAHFNEIKRFDNLTMIRLLKIPLTKLNKIASQNFSKFLLVDGQPYHQESFAKFNYDVVIGHHPMIMPVKAPFVDIRPEYGATATIMTEYLQAAKIRPSKSLATALVYAIRSDTRNFEAGAQDEDVRAFQFLFQHTNMHLLSRIEAAEMGLPELPYFQQALENRRLREGKIFSHVGRIHSHDTVVLVADFLMKCHEVTWAIVFGICRKKMVIVIRNDGLRKNADHLASKAFGTFGNAGGHRAMARVEIPLKNLEGHIKEYDNAKLSQFVVRKFRAIGASNYSAARLAQSLEVSEKTGYPRYESLQPLFNLYDRVDYEKELEPLCRERGLGVISYFSLASGFLTGKYRSEGDLSKRAGGDFVKKYLNAPGFAIIGDLDKVAQEHNMTPAQVALSWLIAHPGITAPIASATNLEQLNELIKATSIELNPYVIDLLNQASAFNKSGPLQ